MLRPAKIRRIAPIPCAALLLASIGLSALPGQVAAEERLASHCQAIAAAAPTILPTALGDGLEANRLLIRYLHHSSFAIATSEGQVAVTDYTGFLGRSDLVPDVVTMNNAHDTHWTPNPDPRIPHVLDGWPGPAGPAAHRLDLGGMLVRNVTTDTRGPFGEGARANANSIFIFEAAGLCIAHLGHLHQIPSDAQYAEIGRVDILMVPVDGGYTLRLADMIGVVRRLKASVVIPMHWFSGATLRVFLDEMAAEFDLVETGLNEMAFDRRSLPARPTILLLEPRLLDE